MFGRERRKAFPLLGVKMKFRAIVLSVLLTFSTMSYAVFFLPLLPGIAIAFESGAVAVGYAAAVAMIGGALSYIAFADPAVDAAATPPVYVRLTPNAPVPTPEGWESGQNGSDPVPPVVPGFVSFDPNQKYRRAYVVKNLNTGVWRLENYLGGVGTYADMCKDLISTYHNAFVCMAGDHYVYNGDSAGDGLDSVSDWGVSHDIHPFNNPDAPFPADNILVINQDSGNYVPHPKDTADAQASAVTFTGNGFSYSKDGSSFDLTDDGINIEITSVVPDGAGNSAQTVLTATRQSNGDVVLTGGHQSTVSGVRAGSTANGDGGGNGGCGGPGQSACLHVLDDSGFVNKGDTSSERQQMDDSSQAHLNAIDNAGNDLDISHTWLPSLFPGPVVQCRKMDFVSFISKGPLSGLSGSYSLDICDKLDLVRQVLNWMFGVFTVIYVFRAFVKSNSTGG
jgi:hypothetical protein